MIRQSPPAKNDKWSHFRSGFSVVEVVLALLVVNIGILAVFGLFTSGLDTNRKTLNDTAAANFAETVFSAFRAMPFTNVVDGATIPPPVLGVFGYDAEDIAIYDRNNAVPIQTNLYTYTMTTGAELDESILRYELSYLDQGFVKEVMLYVWMGLRSDDKSGLDPDDASFFYTELYDWNMY